MPWKTAYCKAAKGPTSKTSSPPLTHAKPLGKMWRGTANLGDISCFALSESARRSQSIHCSNMLGTRNMRKASKDQAEKLGSNHLELTQGQTAQPQETQTSAQAPSRGRQELQDRVSCMAMGQSPGYPPVNIPIPTKIGSKMGGEFTYQSKWYHWFAQNQCDRLLTRSN